MKETISVIFPIYKKWELVHRRLWELNEISLPYGEKLEVILSDDFSEDEQVEKGLVFWEKRGPFQNIKTIQNERNLGFGGNLNQAVEKSQGTIVVLHSTDVEIMGDYLKEIIDILSEKPDALVGGRYLDYDTGWNKFGDRLFPYLEGWMLACHRNTWDKLGGFDLRYTPYDYEDIDLSTTALGMGIELVTLKNNLLVHGGGGTIYAVHGVEGRRKVTDVNKEKFKEKWVTHANSD